MDDKATAEVVNQWLTYLVPVILTVLSALGGMLAVIGRKLWVGGAHYAEKGWLLAEKAVNKHLEFTDKLAASTDKLAESMDAQTELLAEIKVDTTKASNIIDQLGSDPTKSGEIKLLVESLRNSPSLCKYSKEELEKYLKVILKHRHKQPSTET